jgi:hypothetical protein
MYNAKETNVLKELKIELKRYEAVIHISGGVVNLDLNFLTIKRHQPYYNN